MEHNQPGLIIVDLAVGEGAPVTLGDTVIVRHHGFVDGVAPIQTSADQTRFTVGALEVIEGWDYGVRGMQVGGRRRLVVPPDLGYRALGLQAAGISGGATLVFEIELIERTAH